MVLPTTVPAMSTFSYPSYLDAHSSLVVHIVQAYDAPKNIAYIYRFNTHLLILTEIESYDDMLALIGKSHA